MPRYDDSPGPPPSHGRDHSRGHSPLDRRGNDNRRMKSSPMLQRRAPRDQSPPPMSSHHQQHRGMRDAYDDYPQRSHQMKDMGGHGGGHRGGDAGGGGSMPYKILCVSNLNPKYSDNSIRDSLMREFHRFGEPSVKLVQDGSERLAYLYFRSYDDARDARHAKSRLLMYDKPVIIDPIYERAMQMPRRQRSISPDYGPPPSRRMDRMDRMDRPGPPPSPPMQRRMDHRGGQSMPNQSMGRNMGQDKMYMQPSHHRNDNYNNNRDNMGGHMGGRGGGGGGDYGHHHSGSNSGGMRDGNHQHSGGGGGGGGNNRQQHRDSKKEKFPNYLHHIAPEDDEKATRTLFIEIGRAHV